MTRRRAARITAEEAETYGTEAQERAEAIAGQVSQAAEQLNIELEALGDPSRCTASAVDACVRSSPPSWRGRGAAAAGRPVGDAAEQVAPTALSRRPSRDLTLTRTPRPPRRARPRRPRRASRIRSTAPPTARPRCAAAALATRAGGSPRRRRASPPPAARPTRPPRRSAPRSRFGRQPGDAAAHARWLRLRDFRTATRFSRPGIDATPPSCASARARSRRRPRTPPSRRTSSTATSRACANSSTTPARPRAAGSRRAGAEQAAQAAGLLRDPRARFTAGPRRAAASHDADARVRGARSAAAERRRGRRPTATRAKAIDMLPRGLHRGPVHPRGGRRGERTSSRASSPSCRSSGARHLRGEGHRRPSRSRRPVLHGQARTRPSPISVRC